MSSDTLTAAHKELAVIESRQTKETDMHEHTALATDTNHDHRTFDEFDLLHHQGIYAGNDADTTE
ncbi:MAG: hypothetical protein MR570_01755 [Bifidobacterium pseudolongum]|nr:hypothetical protein [Bifidobacterium pseudolongum]